jgi:hypothetical protein
VIDVYAPPLSQADLWDRELEGLDVRKVYLLPTYESCRHRNALRIGAARLDEKALRHNYDEFEWCLRRANLRAVLDNSAMAVAETVERLDDLLRQWPNTPRD